ncbi:MAG TPA: gliding motility lipoprotein GldH [Mucilaginibacter sp.]|nr:gliding motility lipoprotein GldH [Mucilaginibacter sp.]
MKATRDLLFFLSFLSASAFMMGCSDPNTVIDRNTAIDNHNWSYTNKIREDVQISDASIPYNIDLNLRVTGDYRYSNIYILLHRNGPGLKADTRFEVKLANPDGQWLGTGSGNLYSFQVPLITGFKFPAKGTYHFEIEQNMRDNPLHEVSDVGLRVEKAK